MPHHHLLKKTAWALPLWLALTSTASLAAPGEEWEYQGTLDMMGMKMPIQPTKRCQGKDDPMTPPMESHCQFTDVKRSGHTTRFAFRCSKPDEGSGSGTITVTGTTLQSDYTIKTPDGEGTVKLNGRKLGACKVTPQAAAPGMAPGMAPEQTAAAMTGAASPAREDTDAKSAGDAAGQAVDAGKKALKGLLRW